MPSQWQNQDSQKTMLLAFIIFLSVLLVGMGYSGFRIWHILPVPILWIKIVLVTLWIVPFFTLFLQIKRSQIQLWLAQWSYIIGTTWMFMLLYVVLIFFLLDLGRLFMPGLRAFLVYSLPGTVCISLFVTGIFVYGNSNYYNIVRVPLEISLEKPLRRSLKIVGIADLHLGYTISRGELSRWVELINAEDPDLIIIAGDIIEGDTRSIMADGSFHEINKLRAKYGVYACLGNHEYIGKEDDQRGFLGETNIRFLRDETVLIVDSFYIVGRDDRINDRRKSIEELLKDIDHRKPVFLLDHQPYKLYESQAAGVDFQFSGHTHNGQVFPVTLVVQNIYEQPHGWLRRGGTQYYISSGLGAWGSKIRIGTQSEYVVITMHGADMG